MRTVLVVVAAVLVVALTPTASAATATRSVRVGDATLAYRVAGEGTPVVLVTGYAVAMDEWDPAFVDALAKRHTVVMFDNRGAGRSKGPTDGLTIHTMAEDTYRLIRKLKLRKPAVLGWSMGGTVVQDLAVNHEKTLGSIALFATATGGPGTVPFDGGVLQRLAPGHTQDDLWDLNFTSRSAYRAYKKRRGNVASVSDTTQTAQFVATGTVLSEGYTEIWDALPRLKLRTLVAAGTLDTVLPAKNTPRIASRIPKATLVQYPGLKHAFMFQKPTKVAGRLAAFLRPAR